jgi:hypothetical protein
MGWMAGAFGGSKRRDGAEICEKCSIQRQILPMIELKIVWLAGTKAAKPSEFKSCSVTK